LDGASAEHLYAIAFGSNRARSARLGPEALLRAAFDRLDQPPCRLLSASEIITSAPLGPSRRRYANAAALVLSGLGPAALLRHLKRLEREAGRRNGRRWGERRLDLDIILWSGGRWRERDLVIPHRAFRQRDFVLKPLMRIAARWRDPDTQLEVRHLLFRAMAPKPVDRSRARH